ncbi:formin-2-like [Cervus elaphus]|uniref:formin-2-like n=1 Tax=Cervus elaphus TaxID=9860 RepID=UPI001CC2E182|nr:formin-2-like [Cervus elaphus]
MNNKNPNTRYYANPSFLCAKEEGFGEGVRHEIYFCGQRKGCRGEFLPATGTSFGFSGPKEPQEGHLGEATDRGAACTLRSSFRRLGTPRHPPRPEIGVCPLKGEGVPDVLANPRCGVASGRCPAPRPQPRALLPPLPGPRRNDARSQLPPPPLGYLGPGGRRRRRRCGVSVSDTCFAEKPPPPAFPELSLQPPPPPGPENAPGSRSSSWPPATASSSCPSSSAVLLPTPTGQPPSLPPPPPSGL